MPENQDAASYADEQVEKIIASSDITESARLFNEMPSFSKVLFPFRRFLINQHQQSILSGRNFIEGLGNQEFLGENLKHLFGTYTALTAFTALSVGFRQPLYDIAYDSVNALFKDDEDELRKKLVDNF